jgi:hypothetical protein
MKLADKLVEMFGTDYIVKNKQVEKLISNDKVEVIGCSYNETLDSHFIRLNKITKSLGVERNVIVRAKQLEDGTWWIQQG